MSGAVSGTLAATLASAPIRLKSSASLAPRPGMSVRRWFRFSKAVGVEPSSLTPRDPHLGKVMRYQLRYIRMCCRGEQISFGAVSTNATRSGAEVVRISGTALAPAERVRRRDRPGPLVRWLFPGSDPDPGSVGRPFRADGTHRQIQQRQHD